VSKNIILYVGGFELPDKNAAAQRCISNAKILRDIGYEVVLVGVSKQASVELPLSKAEHFGFTCWNVPYPGSSKEWLKHIITLNQIDYLIEKQYKNRVFSIICYNYPAISQMRTKIIAKKLGALAIADVTEWYAASGNNLLRKSIKWFDTWLRMRCVNLSMDGIITTSTYLTEFYRRKNMQCVELPTLYDKDQLCVNASAVEPSGGYKLMYAGSPFDVASAAKNRKNVKERLDVLIDMLFNLCSEDFKFSLNIFGLTRNDYLHVYPEDSVKLERLGENVQFKGRQSHTIIIDNIINSDFTIFFRDINRVTQAGFPSKFSESITCGVPVITNLISNIAPYVVDGKNCFLLDFNKDSRVEKMREILLSPYENISEAKRFCFDSRTFDYHTYKSEVINFLRMVG